MPEICIVNKRDYSVVMKQFPDPTSSRPASGVCLVSVYCRIEVKGFPFIVILQCCLICREFIKHTKTGFLCCASWSMATIVIWRLVQWLLTH